MKASTTRHIWFVCLVFISLFSSCYEQKRLSEEPEDLLPPDKMISFLVDLHLAEAKMGYGGMRDADSLEIVFRNYEYHLFDKHNIKDSAYYHSYEYYLSNMDQLYEIYSSVVDSLSVLNSLEKNKDLVISNKE